MFKVIGGAYSIIMLMLLLFTGLAPQAKADMINPSQHFIDHCYKLENIATYPGFTFISRTFTNRLGGSGWTNKVINRDSCNRLDREVSQLQICATKNKLDDQDISDNVINEMTCSKVLELQSISALPNSNPTQKITEVLNIDRITDTDVYIKKLKVVYNYNDGETEELLYKYQDVRPVSSRATAAALLWYGLPAGALLVIFFIIIRRYRKRQRHKS